MTVGTYLFLQRQASKYQIIPEPHTQQYSTKQHNTSLHSAVFLPRPPSLPSPPSHTDLEQQQDLVLALGELRGCHGDACGALHQLRLLEPRDLRWRRGLDAALHRDQGAVLVRQDLRLLGELRTSAARLLLTTCWKETFIKNSFTLDCQMFGRNGHAFYFIPALSMSALMLGRCTPRNFSLKNDRS